jgi:uncharacterized protein YecE (DUF72 family)
MTRQGSLFDDDDEPLRPQAARLAPKLRTLADRGVYLGTSSWKYPGWLRSIYTPERYESRGKFSQKKFEAECLAEYARTFRTVGGDFSFYQFPSPDYWARLFDRSPESLTFGLKVPEAITVAKWPGHARYGRVAGQENDSFLDASFFTRAFVKPLEPYAARVATMIFEFGTFSQSTFPTAADFFSRLDAFLGKLPTGPRYAVEIRNPNYLFSDYFATLTRHNVAHVFNAWTRMPPIHEQMKLPGAFTADFIAVRALLSVGKSYEQSVKDYEPYDSTKVPNHPTREALAQIARRAIADHKSAYIYLNNRLEGHAPSTIEAVVDLIGG